MSHSPTPTRRLLPDGLRVSRMDARDGSLALLVEPASTTARCPLCNSTSARVHSRYPRTLADLPWRGIAVSFRVRARRFFCGNGGCERSVFCERLPDVAAHARKTGRLEAALSAIAFGLGGEAGARLARELGLLVSPDALLARARRQPRAPNGRVRVLGVDDFAFRKGNAYGTILVDLERRRVVDLLPECSQESLSTWLRHNPGVEVATRDRSRVYREGITKGAPSAAQVADRWHLLRGLALALEEYLLRKRPALRDAARETENAEADGEPGAPDPSDRPGSWRARKEEAARQRHERLVDQWKGIRRLHLAGANARFIARKLGIGPRTVYRYKDLTEPPPRQTYTTRASVLDPYVPYLLKRWSEGCRDGKRLLREIREQGYANSERTFIRFTAELRRAEADGNPPSSTPRAKKGSVAGLSPTAKNVAGLFMRREEKLSEEQKEYLGRLCASDVALSDARRLTQEFAGMVRSLEGEKLDGWLAEAEASEAEVMGKFAAGLKKDLSAVRAGLTESWSNGPVEGFVHKLKLVKRQGYGRAGFDLLRARVLAA
ncbi:MAG: ISL3 family transposase [Actinomycetota bacterium]|nr:ISL3 family transposase [Actinomycetota bacterium]